MISIILGILLVFTVLYSIKKNTEYRGFEYQVRNKVKELYEPLRYGYYKFQISVTNPLRSEKPTIDLYVYIKEITQYTSGDSKIKLDRIEITNNQSDTKKENDVLKFIEENFVTLKKTSDITWLEETVPIIVDRKNKIDNILDLIGKKKKKK